MSTELERLATRLAERLRVHADSAGTGYVQDPEADDDTPTEPGMSDRWCYHDQKVLEQYDHLFGRDTAHHSPACPDCRR
jgi:hypothetical protein